MLKNEKRVVCFVGFRIPLLKVGRDAKGFDVLGFDVCLNSKMNP